MPDIFEKTTIKSLELDNRTVRSATWSGVGDTKGFVTDRAVEFYGNLAAGGVGLIVTGFQYVMPNAVAMPYQIGNYCDGQLDGLTRLAQAIHARDGKAITQLVHTGSKAKTELFPEEGEIWGASALPDPLTGTTPKEMTRQEIALTVEAFAGAAARAQKAGFDGIQLHGAHGYGINQFLSGASNKRSDAYGGDIGSRYRFLGEIMEAVRGAVGQDFPIFIKLSGNDFMDGGLVPEESLYLARRLVEDGIDCIEVSGGNRAAANGMVPSRLNILKEENEGYLAELARRFKEAVAVPIVTVGGIRSFSVASRLLSEGLADYVAFCRPLIREPLLIDRWKKGDLRKATCISCNGCFDTGLEGSGVTCKVDGKKEEKGREGS